LAVQRIILIGDPFPFPQRIWSPEIAKVATVSSGGPLYNRCETESARTTEWVVLRWANEHLFEAFYRGLHCQCT
jgi:hypothetical protein